MSAFQNETLKKKNIVHVSITQCQSLYPLYRDLLASVVRGKYPVAVSSYTMFFFFFFSSLIRGIGTLRVQNV